MVKRSYYSDASKSLVATVAQHPGEIPLKIKPSHLLYIPLPRDKMTEVSFAKSFLTALDSKPAKLPADYVEDPRNYPARTPVSF